MKKYTILFFSLFLFSFPIQGADFLVIEGQIIDSGGVPVEAASVDFVLEILDPVQTCVIYEETHSSIVMTGSNGMFSFKLGSGGSGSNGTYAGAFDNSVPSIGCFPSGTYNPTPGDQRFLRISYDDGVSGVQTLTQNIEIGASAYALNAQKLDGLTSADILRVNNSGFILTQTNLESVFTAANYTELMALLGGTSTQYLTVAPAADFSMNSNRITDVAAPTGANDAANKNYVDTNLGQATVADFSGIGAAQDGHVLTWNNAAGRWENQVPSATDITKLPLDGTTAMTGNLDLGSNNINNVTTANIGDLSTLSNAAIGNDLSVAGNSFLTGNISVGGTSTFTGAANFTGSATASNINVTGTASAADLSISNNAVISNDLDVSGNVSIVGGISTNGVSSDGGVSLFNGANFMNLQAHPSSTTYNLVFPAAAPASNQFLMFDGTDYVWSAPSGSGLTSLGGQTGSTQTFAAGSAGFTHSISSAGDVHTLNIPYASAGGSVTSGTISNADYVAFSNKLDSVGGSTLADSNIWVGDGANQAQPVTISGDATLSNTGALAIVTNAIDGNKLNDGAVTNVHITTNAVDSSHINDGTITNLDINSSANINANKLGVGNVDNTEFQYLDGVTSAIQTQLDSKLTPGAHPGIWSLGSSDNDFALEAHGAPRLNLRIDTARFETLTGGLLLPMGNTGERAPANSNGHIRYNTDTNKVEAYQAGNWYDVVETPPANLVFSDASNGGGPLDIGTTDSNHIRFSTFGTERMRIRNSDGFVGIGTNNPNERLQVQGNIGVSGGVIGNNPAGFVLANPNDMVIHYNQADGTNRFRIESGSAMDVRMVVDNLGRVGIGTNSPTARLDVNGDIKVGFGSSCAVAADSGKMRWDTGQLEVCDGVDWHTLSDRCPTGWNLVGEYGDKGSICVSPAQSAAHYMNGSQTCAGLDGNNNRASICSHDQLRREVLANGVLPGVVMTRDLIAVGAVITVNTSGIPVGQTADLNTTTYNFHCCIE